MNKSIKYKLQTIVANCKMEQTKKNTLASYIETLTDENIMMLITTFRKYPLAITIYADYIDELQKQSKPVPAEKFEEILTPLLSMLE